MAWLFFIDESGHDHRNTPYEVRGGFAIHVSRLWSFVQDMQRLEVESFGCRLHEYKKEIKGATLIDRKRFGFARQGDPFKPIDRQKLCRLFLANSQAGVRPRRDEFTAYGQACLRMAKGAFGLMKDHEAVLLASAIPRGSTKPPAYEFEDYLRKDEEIASMFGPEITGLQLREQVIKGGRTIDTYGVVYVPDPYQSRTEI